MKPSTLIALTLFACMGKVASQVEIRQIPSKAPHPLDEFHEQAPLPTFRELQDLAHDGKRYILLDGDPKGRALVSEDGKAFAWQDLKLPEPLKPARIVHSDGSYVLLAGGRIWHRPGWEAEWKEATGLGDKIFEIRSVGNAFWAWSDGSTLSLRPKIEPPSGNRSTLYRSEDGKTWAPADLDLVDGSQLELHELIHAKGTFWLAGSDYSSSGGLWKSKDGITWDRVDGIKVGVRAICEGPAGILAACDDGMMAVSLDGENWSSKRLPFSSDFDDKSAEQLFYSDGNYQALLGSISSPSTMAESKDGVDWRYSTLGGNPHPGYREAIMSFSGRTAIVLHPLEPKTANADVSGNGSNTTPPKASEREFNYFEISKFKKVGEKLFILGMHGKLWTVPGAGKGYERLLPNSPWNWTTVVASDSKVVVAGKGGHLAWSDDAISFNHQLLPEGADVHESVWAPELGLFVIVGGKKGAGWAWSSKDGATWKMVSLPGFTNQVTGITWDRTKFIACGENGQLATSTDGASWSSVESSIKESLTAIMWAEGKYVATSSEGLVFTSTDAKQWKSRQANAEMSRQKRGFERIIYGNGVWMLVDRDYQHPSVQSEDLEGWNPTSGRSCFRAIHAFGEFIGTDGRYLMSSADGNLWHLHCNSYSLGSGLYFYSGYKAAAQFRDRIVIAGDDGLIGTSGVWRDYFAEWQREHFDAGELAVASTSGPSADPDNDGWPNALEYALDYDPKVVSRYDGKHARFDRDANEYFFTDGSVANGGIQIHAPTGKVKPGVTVWPERSTDGINWTREGLNVSEDRYSEWGPRLIIDIPHKYGDRQIVRLRWAMGKP